MTTGRSGRLLGGAFAAGAILAGCGANPVTGPTEVEALEVDGVWVFAYQDDPTSSMDAIHSGPAAVVDGCLLIDDTVVVWWTDQLPDVEEIVAALASGATVDVQLGGGGFTVDEGASLDDFPDAVRSRCTAAGLWYASGDPVTITITDPAE